MKRGRGVQEIRITGEEVEKDGVVVHMRYANLPRSLDMLYCLANIGSEKQAIHEAHRGVLGQSPKERHSLKLQRLGGKLTPLE